MTNAEAFSIRLNEDSVSEDKIRKLFSFYNIDPDAEWVMSKSNPINSTFYKLLIERKIAIANVKSISEGGFSITYENSPQWLQEAIRELAYESGCSVLINKYAAVNNSIRDISNLLDR